VTEQVTVTPKVRILTLAGFLALLLVIGAKAGSGRARADCLVTVTGCTPSPSTTTTSTPTPPSTPPIPGSTTTTTAPPRAATHDDAAGARHLLDLVNGERAKAGAPALAMRDDVRSIAVNWSFHMAGAHQLSHNDAYFTPATHSRLGARSEAENVAMNYSVDQAHQALMNSPHHHTNLMNPVYRVAGFAVVVDGDGTYWVTEDFVDPAVARSAVARPAAARPKAVTTGGGSGAGVVDAASASTAAAASPALDTSSSPDALSALLHRGEKATLAGRGRHHGRGPGLLAATLVRGKPLQLTGALLLYLAAVFATRAYSSRRRAETNAS
jgi:uncharacterized protein YkwD